MPPLEQAFVDLEIGSKRQDSGSPGPFVCLFSPQQPKPSKLTIRRRGNSDDAISSELQSLNISERGPKKGVKKTQKKAMTVAFSPSVRVRLIPSQKEISQDQKQSIWYTCEEAKEIRDNAIRVVGKMAQNKALGRNETSRGLETKTPKEHRVRRRRIRRIILTVLKAQNKPCNFLTKLLEQHQPLHSLDSWDDVEFLASIYRSTSRDCVSEAILIASIDAEEACGGSFCNG